MPTSYDEHGNRVSTLLDGTRPIPRSGGFRMEGYYVWGGSVICEGDRYHMFASRWPVGVGRGFPEGYRSHSEIAHAVADNPLGPYAHVGLALAGRGGDHWDGQMTHNPSIHRVGDQFVLFYIGSARQPDASGFRVRQVGYATSDSLYGPWTRLDQPLPLGDDANNPAPCWDSDGSLLLNYRNRSLHMAMASAPGLSGPYTVVSNDLLPGIRLEDGYLYREGGEAHIICEDNHAHVSGHERWGVHLVSETGLDGWRVGDPAVAYTHTVVWEDGERTTFERRERPQLVRDLAGRITHLCTAVLLKGASWCLVQPVG